VTGTLPAFLLLTGHWTENINKMAIGLAIFAVVVFGGLFARMRTMAPTPTPTPTSAASPA
jgi:hypothetical protein